MGRDRDGYEQAQTGIPHAGFRWLKEGGFEVALKNKKSEYDRSLKKRGFGKGDNRIVATRDALIINGKRLRNTECRGFEARGFVAGANGRQNPDYVLGYYYGTVWHEISGAWPPKEATEIVLALNLHWRSLFVTPTNQTEPETLRNTRPTDF